MGAGSPTDAVAKVVEFGAMLSDHSRSLHEFGSWFADEFVREDRRNLIAVRAADAKTFHQQHLAWFEMGDEALTIETVDVIALRGDRLGLSRTHIRYGEGFPVEMLSVWQWNEELSQLQKLVQFDSGDLEKAVQELDRLKDALDSTTAR